MKNKEDLHIFKTNETKMKNIQSNLAMLLHSIQGTSINHNNKTSNTLYSVKVEAFNLETRNIY